MRLMGKLLVDIGIGILLASLLLGCCAVPIPKQDGTPTPPIIVELPSPTTAALSPVVSTVTVQPINLPVNVNLGSTVSQYLRSFRECWSNTNKSGAVSTPATQTFLSPTISVPITNVTIAPHLTISGLPPSNAPSDCLHAQNLTKLNNGSTGDCKVKSTQISMWRATPRWWDISFVIVFIAVHAIAWRSGSSDSKSADHNERNLAAHNLTAAASAGLTAVSILLSANFVIAFQSHPAYPELVLPHLLGAALWFLGSLTVGVFIVFQVPLRAHARSVAKFGPIGGLLGVQFALLIAGVFRMLAGLSRV
jgi:hypothetical protein